MGKFYSPIGNMEVWEQKPQGYFTIEEWRELNPPPLWEPDPKAERQVRILTIKEGLRELDLASTRSIRAILKDKGTPEDHRKLAELEEKADEFRAELSRISGEA